MVECMHCCTETRVRFPAEYSIVHSLLAEYLAGLCTHKGEVSNELLAEYLAGSSISCIPRMGGALYGVLLHARYTVPMVWDDTVMLEIASIIVE